MAWLLCTGRGFVMDFFPRSRGRNSSKRRLMLQTSTACFDCCAQHDNETGFGRGAKRHKSLSMTIWKGFGTVWKVLWADFVQYFFCAKSACPKMSYAQGIMPLGQAHARFIEHDVAMIESWRRPLQCAIKKQLPSGGFQKISSANDFCDPHRGVVDHHCQLVCGNVVAPPDHEVAKIASSDKMLGTEMKVGKPDLLAVGDTKSPVHSGGLGKFLAISPAAASTGIDRLVIGVIGRTRRLGQILTRTGARIDKAGIAQFLPCSYVVFPPLALAIRRVRSAAIPAFLPMNAQPKQVFDHGRNKFRPRSLRIKIFVAQDQDSVTLSRSLRCDQEGPCMAEMKQSGGRRCKTPAINFLPRSHHRILRYGNARW